MYKLFILTYEARYGTRPKMWHDQTTSDFFYVLQLFKSAPRYNLIPTVKTMFIDQKNILAKTFMKYMNWKLIFMQWRRAHWNPRDITNEVWTVMYRQQNPCRRMMYKYVTNLNICNKSNYNGLSSIHTYRVVCYLHLRKMRSWRR